MTLLPHFICLRNLWIFFSLTSFYRFIGYIWRSMSSTWEAEEVMTQMRFWGKTTKSSLIFMGEGLDSKPICSLSSFFYGLDSFESKPRFSQFSSCCLDVIVVFLLFLFFFFDCADSKWFCFYSGEKAEESHMYSYRHGFRGFAAKLTEYQASEMASMFFFPFMMKFDWFFYVGLVGDN